MKPILLLGADAFSPFRLDALKAAMGKLVPGMEKADLRARWVYAVEAEDENGVPPESLERAAALLNVVDGKSRCVRSSKGACCETSFYVSPRKGTISPWSTKATDIFKNCGVKGVKRVERAIRFLSSGVAPDKK